MNEVWRNIPGYESLYQVSNCGRIKSLARFSRNQYGQERILKLSDDGHGYLQVTLCNNGRKMFKVHRLVWDSFGKKNQPSKYKMHIDHIDGNPKNNHIDNLQLLTIRQNVTKEFQQKQTKYPPGVTFHKSCKKFQAQIRIKGKRKYLGCFANPITASQVYERAKEGITI
jgi:hypothetical protein